jgi:aminopeptidase N
MKKLSPALLLLAMISACTITGIHFKLNNPKRAGKYPQKTKALAMLGDQNAKYRTCFDVKYYDIIVSFGKKMDADAGITGSVLMRCVATTDCDTVQIDLGENMSVSSVRLTNFETSWQPMGAKEERTGLGNDMIRQGNALLIPLKKVFRSGEKFNLAMNYEVKPQQAKRPPWRGGFVCRKDDAGNPWWGVACQSEGASLWWPCKDVVNDEPDSAYISLSVPDSLTAVSNGQFVKCSKIYGGIAGRDNENLSWQWKTTYPINLYNITFYIGKYKVVNDTLFSKVTGDTLALNHYVLEQHYDVAKEHFRQVKDHIAAYEELFGPYPFYNDGFKLVESPFAGMEHQTAIAYGDKFKNNSYGFDYIILHETAHEWWGNSVTAEDLAEGWIHEGFATYAECLYVEKTRGRQAYTDYMRTYRWTIINRRPVVGPYGLRYFNYKDSDIYVKGAWILHTLRETINNDPVFFDIIKTFATRNMYRNVTSADFISVVNEKTGKDYNWFFDQYLHNRFVPELEYCTDKKGLFYYRWNPEYTNDTFPLPVTIVTSGVTDHLLPKQDTVSIRPLRTMNEEVNMHTDILVKFTENKRLLKLFKKQAKSRVQF